MIAARLHRYQDPLVVEQIAEPEITAPPRRTMTSCGAVISGSAICSTVSGSW